MAWELQLRSIIRGPKVSDSPPQRMKGAVSRSDSTFTRHRADCCECDGVVGSDFLTAIGFAHPSHVPKTAADKGYTARRSQEDDQAKTCGLHSPRCVGPGPPSCPVFAQLGVSQADLFSKFDSSSTRAATARGEDHPLSPCLGSGPSEGVRSAISVAALLAQRPQSGGRIAVADWTPVKPEA